MDMLRVRGDTIVNQAGEAIRLRGTFLGGWMNMENWMNGYPGTEHERREACERELGPERAQFLLDRSSSAYSIQLLI